MHSTEQPFKEFYSNHVWPKLQHDIERLVKTVPKRVAQRVAKDKAEKGEGGIGQGWGIGHEKELQL